MIFSPLFLPYRRMLDPLRLKAERYTDQIDNKIQKQIEKIVVVQNEKNSEFEKKIQGIADDNQRLEGMIEELHGQFVQLMKNINQMQEQFFGAESSEMSTAVKSSKQQIESNHNTV